MLYDDEKRLYDEFGTIEAAENSYRRPNRGIVLIDGERTVRYWWQAEDNWDEWRMDPISDVVDVFEGMGAA